MKYIYMNHTSSMERGRSTENLTTSVKLNQWYRRGWYRMGVPEKELPLIEDCLECRITGTATLGTLSAYFLKESHQASRKYGGKNKVFFGVTGVTFAVAAGYRWFGMKQE